MKWIPWFRIPRFKLGLPVHWWVLQPRSINSDIRTSPGLEFPSNTSRLYRTIPLLAQWELSSTSCTPRRRDSCVVDIACSSPIDGGLSYAIIALHGDISIIRKLVRQIPRILTRSYDKPKIFFYPLYSLSCGSNIALRQRSSLSETLAARAGFDSLNYHSWPPGALVYQLSEPPDGNRGQEMAHIPQDPNFLMTAVWRASPVFAGHIYTLKGDHMGRSPQGRPTQWIAQWTGVRVERVAITSCDSHGRVTKGIRSMDCSMEMIKFERMAIP